MSQARPRKLVKVPRRCQIDNETYKRRRGIGGEGGAAVDGPVRIVTARHAGFSSAELFGRG